MVGTERAGQRTKAGLVHPSACVGESMDGGRCGDGRRTAVRHDRSGFKMYSICEYLSMNISELGTFESPR